MDDKYLEYFAAMIDELRNIKAEMKQLNQKFDNLSNGVDKLEARMERVEKQQAKTNLLLNRIDRDLIALVEDSPRYERVMKMEILKTSGKKQTVILRKN